MPPYSLKFSDYATTTAEKLKLMLLMTDVNEGNLQVRLRISIEGDRISVRSTDFVQGAMPIRLVGGVPTRLSNLDLRPYFELRNLQGINPRQYNTPLPDGLYRFCFEVFDFVTGRRLSQKRCIPVYLVLNDPPFLNLPQRGEQIAAANPQNLIFQWTPRHLNATGVQYEFQLRELWDGGIDPQAAFLSSPDLYSTTTFATTLHYGPGETSLLEGRRYGWRVRAIVSDGISETAVFRNDGHSEIFHFTYTGKCDAPRFVLAMSEGTTAEKITWQVDPDHIGYRVQFRKAAPEGGGRGDRIWFESEVTETEKTLRFLEPSTEYEFRVGGQCTQDGGYSYSAINTFTTPSREEASAYNCGIPPEILITNQDPLEALSQGDGFTAGDFPVRVTEATGGNGTFSGKGVIEVPYLGLIRIGVKFENISINTDRQMTDGTVETQYDPGFADFDRYGGNGLSDELAELSDLADEITDAIGDAFRRGEIGEEEHNAQLAEIGILSKDIEEAEEALRTGGEQMEKGTEGEDPEVRAEGEAKISEARAATEEVRTKLREKAAELGVTAGAGEALADNYFDELLPIQVAGKGEIPIGVLDGNGSYKLRINASDSLLPPLEPKTMNIDGNAYTFLITSSRDSEAHIGATRGLADSPENGITVYLHYDLEEEVMGYKISFAKGHFGQLTPEEEKRARLTLAQGIANLREAYAAANAVDDWSVVLLEATTSLNERLKEAVTAIDLPGTRGTANTPITTGISSQ